MMRTSLSPCVTAAATKSRERTSMVSARTMRKIAGAEAKVTASTMLVPEAPSATMMTM